MRNPARRLVVWLAAGLALVVAVFGIGESMGWPWLAQPIERALSSALHRPVSLAASAGGGDASVRVHLLGAVRLDAARLEIADLPRETSGTAQPLLVATDVRLRLRWPDVWMAAWRPTSGPLKVQELLATSLEVHARRSADGRANWDFAEAASASASASAASSPTASLPTRVPRFERLLVERAKGSIDDAVLALQATFDAALDSAAGGKGSFSAHAQGRWQKQPLRASLKADSPLPLVAADSTETVAVNVQLDAGRSALRFDGRIADLLSHQRLDGRFSLRGPSLADVGQAVRITLPSTPAFDLQGRIEHATQGPPRVWNVEITRGLIGSSDLAGSVSFDARGIDPAGRGRLSGALHSRMLWLPDLGPAIGARAPGQPAPPQQPADRILPQSTFDLPALRAMDADVKLAVQSLRLDRPPSADKAASDAPAVKPIEPLSLRIQLDDGVLRLADIVAGLAQGRIEGEMVLDAKEPNAPAKWQARLNARNVRIEQFVPAVGQRAVPWASGRLTARVSLDGRGRSTAELLASADGSITLLWSGGTVSHLAIEAMGLDIAQGLGRLLRGDESLPVICGAAYLRVKNGRAEPSPAVIDTRDSTVWLDGSATLADERLDLRATVSPKDRSWLSLRSPLVLRGSFIKPEPGVQSGQIAKRLLPGVLLALINPLAGLLPLVDTGDREAAQQAAAACTRLTVGSYGKPAPAPTVLR